MHAQYTSQGEARPGVGPVGNQIVASVATSFLILVGVFYPSVTGEPSQTLLHLSGVRSAFWPVVKKVQSFIVLWCCLLHRHHGGLQSVWRFEGPSEVHPLGHPRCHSNHNYNLYHVLLHIRSCGVCVCVCACVRVCQSAMW